MVYVTSLLLALSASTITAFPHLPLSWTHLVEPPTPKRGVSHHMGDTLNSPIHTRAEKGTCTTLDLPTKEQYKIGYEAFCNKFVPGDAPLQISNDDLTGTILLKNHLGADLPWVFKVSSEKWAGAVSKRTYFLNRSVCIAKFRDVLEGENAKLGDEYCVVDGSKANGDGKGVVLVKGGKVRDWPSGMKSQSNALFETRKRKGDFDPNKERKKGKEV